MGTLTRNWLSKSSFEYIKIILLQNSNLNAKILNAPGFFC